MVLKHEPLNGKALFRKAQVLHAFQKYRESSDLLKILCKEQPTNSAASTLLKQTIFRITEKEKGIYDYRAMQKSAITSRAPCLDHATYVGPISVRSTSAHGRGVFTTKSVKAGDLLLCEKAFGYAFADPESSRGAGTTLINPQADNIFIGMHNELIADIVQKLHRNPSIAPVIDEMYHGPYDPVKKLHEDDGPVVDT